MPHRARDAHAASRPVHVTLRSRRIVPSLRTQLLFQCIAAAIAKASHSGFRVVHFSVQADHVHLIVEAATADRLFRGVVGLTTRLARQLNGTVRRRGPVWLGRYHGEELRSPRHVRNTLRYVLQSAKKHERHLPRHAAFVDPFSSAPWFDGWVDRPPLAVALTAAPHTWLITKGWRRHGLIDPTEAPGLR